MEQKQEALEGVGQFQTEGQQGLTENTTFQKRPEESEALGVFREIF